MTVAREMVEEGRLVFEEPVVNRLSLQRLKNF